MNGAGSSNDCQRIEALFQQALDLPPTRRSAFLDSSCPRELRGQVETLLNHYDAAPPTYLSPALNVRVFEQAAAEVPARIGRYEVVRLIGQGGMGTVYEARQDNPRRNIAVKVMRSPLASPEARRRFEYEATILARLQHPGIAHIYEAGVSEPGDQAAGSQPYFAMELIPGAPMQQHLRGVPALRARVELFVLICDAVEHAHQKGVIHRDLKPANILVTADGRPKILDFGVARATDADQALTTMHTQAVQVLGTIPYMSPEQAAGRLDQLDTRSDVYSLGVILYEMLVGRLPYDLSGLSLVAASRAINEQPPQRLGVQNRAARGDLEVIVHKALEKDPAQRYASVHALSADLRRLLRGEPITARPATTVYQLRKLARRRPGLVFGTGATLLALLAGSIGVAWFASRAIEEARRAREQTEIASVQARLAREQTEIASVQARLAREQTEIAEASKRFLTDDLLRSVWNFTHEGRGKDVRMMDVVEDAERRLLEGEGLLETSARPQVEAAIRAALGATFHALGEPDRAAAHLERALELNRTALGAQHPETLRCLRELGSTRLEQGRYGEAVDLLSEDVAALQALPDASFDTRMESLGRLGNAYLYAGRHPEAQAAFEEALAAQQERYGPADTRVARTITMMSELYRAQGRLTEAEPLIRRALQIQHEQLGPDHEETVASVNHLALILRRLNQTEEAEQLYRRAQESSQRVFGPDHPRTITTLNNLAVLYSAVGRYAEAEPLYVQALEGRRRVLGPDHPLVFETMASYGYTLRRTGRGDEAERMFLDALAGLQRTAGPEHPQTLLTRGHVAALCRERSKLPEAVTHWTAQLEGQRRTIGAHHVNTLKTVFNLGEVLHAMERYAEAEPLIREALDVRTTRVPPTDEHLIETRILLASILRGLERYAEAEPLMEESWAAIQQAGDRLPSGLVRFAMDKYAQLYEAWHAADPRRGFDEQAAEWRTRLSAASQPASNPSGG